MSKEHEAKIFPQEILKILGITPLFFCGYPYPSMFTICENSEDSILLLCLKENGSCLYSSEEDLRKAVEIFWNKNNNPVSAINDLCISFSHEKKIIFHVDGSLEYLGGYHPTEQTQHALQMIASLRPKADTVELAP